MNETDSNSKGMPQMSKIEPDEKLGICALCGNKNKIEKKFVTCVTESRVGVYANAEKATSKKKMYSIKFDLRIWDLFLCHSCILENRDRAFTRKSESISSAIKGFTGGILMISFFYLLILIIGTRLGPAFPFNSIMNLIKSMLPSIWILCLGGIIISTFLYLMNKLKHRKFILNKDIRKEKDKIKAFAEAGQRILKSLEVEKDASSFKHFPLPKLPTDEDFLQMFPNKYGKYDEPFKRRYILHVTNDKKCAIPKKWEKLPVSTKLK